MRPFHLLALLAVGIAIYGLHAEAADTEAGFAPGEVLVRFHPGVAAQRISEVEQAYGLVLIDEIAHLSVRHYAIPADSSVPTIVDLLSALPEVGYAEPNHTYEMQGLPAEPRINEQWSLHNTGQLVNGYAGPADIDIDWPEAMDLFTGSGTPVVAVIDSGVALDHPDLFPNRWLNYGETRNGLDDDHNGYVDDLLGWDFFDSDPLPLDENGHGTLVASVIAGAWNGIGISGVAPNARIMALRAADDFGSWGAGTIINFVSATTYATRMGAHIINFSAGRTGGFSRTELAQVQWLDNQGVLLVAAAGNGGDDRQGDNNDLSPVYPASYDVPNVISVAAIDRTGSLAPFSNHGVDSVDLAAPGTDILGADVSRSITYQESFDSFVSGWTHDENCYPCFSWGLWTDLYGDTWLSDGSDYLGVPLPYYAYSETWVDSPWISLPTLGPQLRFREWHALNDLLDIGLVGISTNGVSWTALNLLYGASDTPAPDTSPTPGSLVSSDLSPWAGQSVKFRFKLLSDAFLQADGIYIDDVTVSQMNAFYYDGTQFRFDIGTSFSAPLVAGTAALLLAQQPSLTHHQLRDLILENTDAVGSLNGKVATGGRLNARKALQAAIDTPEPSSVLQGLVGVAAIVALRRRSMRKRGVVRMGACTS